MTRRVPAAKGPRRKPGAGTPVGAPSRRDEAVTALLRASGHPLAAEIDAVRDVVLGSHADIREEVKWNGPSFRTADHFVTLNNLSSPRARDRVLLVFHTGAKAKGVTMRGRVADPAGILEWVAPDRALVTLRDASDVEARRAAVADLVREWLRALP